jgi:hypothetical protein
MSEILGSLFKYFMAALAIVGVVAVAAKAMSSDKVGTAIADTTQTATNIRATFSGNAGGFANLTTARAASGLLAPDSMIVAGALTNPWNGVVTTVVNAGNAFRFDLQHTAVPADACPKLAASQAGLAAASINGTPLAVPVDSGLAITACNAGANNTILFTYNR